MPKVPDLHVPTLTQGPESMASELSTQFGVENMLWTPAMDKRFPSVAEQRIMAVAKATREQMR